MKNTMLLAVQWLFGEAKLSSVQELAQKEGGSLAVGEEAGFIMFQVIDGHDELKASFVVSEGQRQDLLAAGVDEF